MRLRTVSFQPKEREREREIHQVKENKYVFVFFFFFISHPVCGRLFVTTAWTVSAEGKKRSEHGPQDSGDEREQATERRTAGDPGMGPGPSPGPDAICSGLLPPPAALSALSAANPSLACSSLRFF